jgi:bifunctional UDP-N-acetylglucosamine pyrophosphorylase/glucosamine-1-phosphate N-acetyltransferase
MPSTPTTSSDLAVVVLAAGQGTRMRTGRAKVLHPLAGRSLLDHVLAAAAPLEPARTVIVVAPETRDEIATAMAEGVAIAVQDPPRGTGDAVRCALPHLPADGTLLVLYGDTPLLRPATLAALLAARQAADAAVAVLGMRPPDTRGYGRLRFAGDDLVELIEGRHADPELLATGLCNFGVMAVDARRLGTLLEGIELRPEKDEYYLTDIVALAHRQGWRCVGVEGPWQDGVGVNSQTQLAEAEALMQARLRAAALEAGVTMTAPETVFLSFDTRLAPGCRIEPYVVFGPGVSVEAEAQILPFSHLTGAAIGPGALVGPFARLRPGTRLLRGAKIGNFVEAKNTELGAGAKANHLTYLGDTTVGAGANVGAGTITCNYDGFGKHRTEIGEGAFIGSNTALVAPIRVGERAITAAGSTLTEDVSDDALAAARAPQTEMPDGAARFRARRRRS